MPRGVALIHGCELRNSVLPTGSVTSQERRSRSEDISMFVDMVKNHDQAYRLHKCTSLWNAWIKSRREQATY